MILESNLLKDFYIYDNQLKKLIDKYQDKQDYIIKLLATIPISLTYSNITLKQFTGLSNYIQNNMDVDIFLRNNSSNTTQTLHITPTNDYNNLNKCSICYTKQVKNMTINGRIDELFCTLYKLSSKTLNTIPDKMINRAMKITNVLENLISSKSEVTALQDITTENPDEHLKLLYNIYQNNYDVSGEAQKLINTIMETTTNNELIQETPLAHNEFNFNLAKLTELVETQKK